MEKCKVKKEFIYFLKRNSVYEKYTYNFERRQELLHFYAKKSFVKYFRETPHVKLISSAFAWAFTKEQYNFLKWVTKYRNWENLDYEDYSGTLHVWCDELEFQHD